MDNKEGIKWLNAARTKAYWEGHADGYDKATAMKIPALLLNSGGFVIGVVVGALFGSMVIAALTFAVLTP